MNKALHILLITILTKSLLLNTHLSIVIDLLNHRDKENMAHQHTLILHRHNHLHLNSHNNSNNGVNKVVERDILLILVKNLVLHAIHHNINNHRHSKV